MSLGVFPENSCLPGIEPDVLNCTPKSANLALARRRWEKENEWYEMIFGPMRAPLGDDEAPCQFAINQLPSELLADIFYWYIVAVYRCKGHYPSYSPTPYCWLILGHVCRGWRNTLLNYPKLSAHICLTRMDCVKQMLSQAGNIPLRIYDTPFMSKGLDMYTLVLQHFPRFTSAYLDLRIVASVRSPVLLQSGVSKAESLQLDLDVPDDDGCGLDLLLPNITFPHLRHFACSLGSLSMVSNMIQPSLRRLEINRPTHTSPFQLVAALSSLQYLEELVLQDICTHLGGALPTASEITPHQSITLSRLRRFEIIDLWGQTGIYFLHAIIYPATVSVKVQLGGNQSEVHDFVRSVIVSKLNGEGMLGLPPVASSISLLARTDLKIHLTLWEHRQSLDEIERKRYGAESAFFNLSISFTPDEQWVSTLLQQISLSDIRTALLSEHIVDSEPLHRAHLIAGMQSLEELGLEYECYDNVQDTSGEIRGPTGNPLMEGTEPLFPQLKVVKVREFHHTRSFKRVQHVSEYQLLARAFARMKEKGDPRFTNLDLSVNTSPFHSTSTCHCDRSTSHPMSTPTLLNSHPISTPPTLLNSHPMNTPTLLDQPEETVPGCFPCGAISKFASGLLRYVVK